MRGLIWKDFLVMRKTLRSYALLFAIYFGLGLLGVFALSGVTAVLEIIVMLLPISAFSYDELAKWPRYAAALPLSVRQVVGARYLFTLLLAGAALVLGALAGLLFSLTGSSPEDAIAGMLASLGMGLLIADVLLPLCYKLGPERARPWMYVVIFLPLILLFAAAKLGLFAPLGALDALPDAVLLGGLAMIPLAGLAGLGVSYLLSCRIVEHAEF